MQTTSERASIGISELRKTRTPRPARTVIAPKASGIAAATSERKTRSRTMSSSGAASSSARSEAVERFVLQGAGDRRVARLGRLHGRVDAGGEGVVRARGRCRASPRRAARGSRAGRAASGASAARGAARARRRRGPRGRSTVAVGVAAQRRGQAAALALDRRRPGRAAGRRRARSRRSVRGRALRRAPRGCRGSPARSAAGGPRRRGRSGRGRRRRPASRKRGPEAGGSSGKPNGPTRWLGRPSGSSPVFPRDCDRRVYLNSHPCCQRTQGQITSAALH